MADGAVKGLVEAVRRVADGEDRLRFAYLFGSAARGALRSGSDVDVAVHLREPVTLYDSARLHQALADAAGRQDLDLVVLNDAPLWLQFRILGEGRVLFSRDDRERIAFRERVEHTFLDFKPFHDEYVAPSANAPVVADRARVDQLLGLLLGYVRILRDLAAVPVEDFAADPRNHGSAERFLQLAIETCLSVGNHLIAAQGLPQPTSYADVFTVLGAADVLDGAFATELEAMARLRNRLVHAYTDVDPRQVHGLLQARLGDFDRFAGEVTRHLDAQEATGEG